MRVSLAVIPLILLIFSMDFSRRSSELSALKAASMSNAPGTTCASAKFGMVLSFRRIASKLPLTFKRANDSESPLAFALLKVRGSFDAILRKLKTIPNFAEAHVVPGAFDILAAFRADSSEELLEKSVEKISSINGITASETLISYNLPEKFGRF